MSKVENSMVKLEDSKFMKCSHRIYTIKEVVMGLLIVASLVVVSVVLACFAVYYGDGPFGRIDENGKPVDSKGCHLREKDRETWERGGYGRI